MVLDILAEHDQSIKELQAGQSPDDLITILSLSFTDTLSGTDIQYGGSGLYNFSGTSGTAIGSRFVLTNATYGLLGSNTPQSYLHSLLSVGSVVLSLA